jgi:tRNA A37 threonylcarbamoyladenosine synthetase subunit TsaC/SUA5/YrdC
MPDHPVAVALLKSFGGSKPRLPRQGHITRQQIETVLQTKPVMPPTSNTALASERPTMG